MSVAQWPDIPYAAWADTCATVHRWTQIVGKVRLACTPWLNHSWHATLYVSARGLTTGPVPYEQGVFELALDLCDHRLIAQRSDGQTHSFALGPMPVAAFHRQCLDALAALGINVAIHGSPNEVPDPVPFAEDLGHASYDADAVHRFWQALLQIDRVFKAFRTGFLGKSSPAHFFWGSFDFAVTRFSGRRAPPHPGGIPALPDAVTREAYSHEVSSAGFWPGGGGTDHPTFYSYAYPTPDGFQDHKVRPDGAFFSGELGEFLLPYDAVRAAPDPDAILLSFLQSTYEAAAMTARWDREALEAPLGQPGIVRSA